MYDSVIQDQIDREVRECQFFSIQVDETTNISAKAQLSAIIHLDRGSQVVERFLKFHNVITGRSAEALSGIIKCILTRYGDSLKSKSIVPTYDGAAVRVVISMAFRP